MLSLSRFFRRITLLLERKQIFFETDINYFYTLLQFFILEHKKKIY